MKRQMQVFRAGLVVAVVLRPRQPSSISRRALLSSLPSVRAPRVCTPRFALGAQRPTTYLPPNWLLPHFSPTFTSHLPKYPISSSVECGSFREKSEGIINQGSHRRRHVTLGRGPDCHQPVQTKHCWSKCALSCVSSGKQQPTISSHTSCRERTS